MRPEQKLSALRKILGREEFQKGDEAVFFCPKHQHYKPKLSVNLKYDNFNCWICGFKGANLKPILFLKGKTDDAVRYASEIDGNRGKHTEDKTYDIPTLPDSFEPLVLGGHDPYTRHAIEYLKSRGLDEYDFLKYKIGFCKEGECRFRVIFPSFDSDGNLNFFVGRKVYDHVGLSYKHGNFNKNIIFNDYLIDWDKPVTLVEGPIDAIIAGDNAIPLQGTILREDSLLFAKIVTSGVHVNIALDSDAKKKEWDMADKLMSYGVNVGIYDIGGFGVNDVAELGKERFRNYIPLMMSPLYGTLRQRIRG